MEALGPALGLGAAAVYGASDFAGGAATRRVSTLWVLAIGQGTALLLGLFAVAVDRRSEPIASAIGAGALAGVLGVAGLGTLYRGLAAGPMGVVAPVATVAHAVVPFVWGLARGERPSGTALVGVLVAVVAVAVIARSEGGAEGGAAQDAGEGGEPEPEGHEGGHGAGNARLGVPLGLAGGAAFGLVAVLLADVSTRAGMWPLVGWRAVSFPVALVALVVVRPRPGPARAVGALAVTAGSLEVLGNGLYLVATRQGLLSLVGVLSSLTPLSTVGLAVVVLRERMGPTRLAALAAALLGVVLIAGG